MLETALRLAAFGAVVAAMACFAAARRVPGVVALALGLVLFFATHPPSVAALLLVMTMTFGGIGAALARGWRTKRR